MDRRKRKQVKGCLLLAMCFGWLVTEAMAHTLPISYLTVIPAADYLHLELTLNPFELSFYAELDRNQNGRLDVAEWETQQTEVARQLLNCLKLRVAGNPIEAEVSGIAPDLDSHHATLRAHYRVDARRQPVSIESSLARLTSGSHFTQVTFGKEGESQIARLDLHCSSVTFAPRHPSDGLALAPQEQEHGMAYRSAAPWAIPLLGFVVLLGIGCIVKRLRRSPSMAAQGFSGAASTHGNNTP